MSKPDTGFAVAVINKAGLTQNITKVGVIHELPLRKNQGFSHILRKSYKDKFIFLDCANFPISRICEKGVLQRFMKNTRTFVQLS